MKNLRSTFLITLLATAFATMSFWTSDQVKTFDAALLPDLLVAVTDSQPEFCANKRNKVFVDIKNIGQYTAKGQISVKIRIDPVRMEKTKLIKINLAPGAATSVTFDTIKFKVGDNRITGTANNDHQMTETNYQNNGMTVSVSVPNCP